MPSALTPYDVLVELVRQAPGRAAPTSAVGTLQQIAYDGDAQAALTLIRLVAGELGLDDSTPALHAARSSGEVARAEDAAPLVRIYAAGYLPRDLLSNVRAWRGVAQNAMGGDHLSAFQQLVRRNAPICDEVLKAYLLSAFVALFGGNLVGDNFSAGARLRVIDQILNEARVIDGEAIDSTFEFGREAILGLSSTRGLSAIMIHELGHHVFDARLLGQEQLPLSGGTRLVRNFAEALPGIAQAAAAAPSQPLAPRDPRVIRLLDGLSAICTYEQLPGGSYTHLSLTDAAGPIELDVAVPLAFCAVTLFGADPASVALALSARGVFHIGVPGAPPPNEQIRQRVLAIDVDGWEGLVAAAGGWYAAMESASRVGREESDVRYTLGVAERPATIFGLDAENAWYDLGVCAQLQELPQLQLPLDALDQLLYLTTRCADPGGLARVLATRGRPAQSDDQDVGLLELGSSLCLVRDGGDVRYVGPSLSAIFLVLEQLRDAGFDLEGPIAADGYSLLTDAAGRNAALVEKLLAVGLDPGRPDGIGGIPLSSAAQFAGVEVAALLVSAGALVNAADADGLTPLHYAASVGNDAVLELLLTHGADVSARSSIGRTPLMLARSVSGISKLCHAGSDRDSTDNEGATALILASARGDIAAVRQLLMVGADPTVATDRGLTALHFAAPLFGDGPDVVDALLDAGAEIDEEDHHGITPLMGAANAFNDDVVERLLARAADVAARTVNGNTALIIACDGRKQWEGRDFDMATRIHRCVRLLVDAGADVNAANDDGDTPLLAATLGFSVELVEMLLSMGANSAARSRGGVTPLDNARRQNNEVIIRALLAAGSSDREKAPGDAQ